MPTLEDLRKLTNADVAAVAEKSGDANLVKQAKDLVYERACNKARKKGLLPPKEEK